MLTVEQATAELEAKRARRDELQAQLAERVNGVNALTAAHKEALRAARINSDPEAVARLPGLKDELRAAMRDLADAEEVVQIHEDEELPTAEADLAAAERRADRDRYTELAGRRGKLAKGIDGHTGRLVASLQKREEVVAEQQQLARRLGMGIDARNGLALGDFVRDALRPFVDLGLADAKARGKSFYDLEREFTTNIDDDGPAPGQGAGAVWSGKNVH